MTGEQHVQHWVDRHGDVWTRGDDGLMHSADTAPFSWDHVDRKWGPLRRITEASRRLIVAGEVRALPDREAIARELLWQRYNPETARRAEAALGGWYRSEWLNALREADAVLALFGQEGQR